MKKLLAIALLLITTTSWSKVRMHIDGYGQIRQGKLFAEPAFLSFRNEVERAVAKRHHVEFMGKDVAEIVVTYEYGIIHETFYGLFLRGTVAAKILNVKTDEEIAVQFDCAFSVNDGGHVTLRPVCARKLAKKIVESL